jgi:hypothetical protein
MRVGWFGDVDTFVHAFGCFVISWSLKGGFIELIVVRQGFRSITDRFFDRNRSTTKLSVDEGPSHLPVTGPSPSYRSMENGYTQKPSEPPPFPQE